MFQQKHTVNKCSFSKMQFYQASRRGKDETRFRREMCQHLPSCATGSEKWVALHSHKQTESRQAMGDKDSQDAINRANDLTPPSRPTPLFCAATPPSSAPHNEDFFFSLRLNDILTVCLSLRDPWIQPGSFTVYSSVFFWLCKGSLFNVRMSQVNPIPKSNGISDEEKIMAG